MTDLSMPRMSGLDLIDEIKQNYPQKKIITIGISAPLNNNNSLEILDVSGKLIDSKPFTTSTIKLSLANYNNGIYFYKPEFDVRNHCQFEWFFEEKLYRESMISLKKAVLDTKFLQNFTRTDTFSLCSLTSN